MNINTFSQEYMSFTEKPEGKRFAGLGCWMGEKKSGMFYLMYPGTVLIIDKRISEIENICECFGGRFVYTDVVCNLIKQNSIITIK